MKCPKCGSEYKTGGTDVNGNAVCKACQLKELKDLGFLNDKNITQTTSSNKIIIETEITTAEMLLWLCSNGFGVNVYAPFDKLNGDIYQANKTTGKNRNFPVCFGEDTDDIDTGEGETSFEQAIKQAYDWAKEQK